MMNKDELKKIPKVDEILNRPEILELQKSIDLSILTDLVRKTLEQIRRDELNYHKGISEEEIISTLQEKTVKITLPSLRKMINGTGIIIHTNLGRAPLGNKIIEEVIETISGYSNLEFDLESGKRGKRASHLIELIKVLTATEDAAVVNNNAAAIFLSLKTLAEGKEVIISRGELIEIGDSFRIPEIIHASGVRLIEVGTTNRTKLSDYESAVNNNTAVIFKAHKSNFFIEGFTEEVDVKKLLQLSKRHNLILIHDLGSGLLFNSDKEFFKREPDVRNSIIAGADLVTFSCDKLLGGPQAGIIAGKKNLISLISKAPLMRTLRVDKLTIAVLSAVLRCYLYSNTLCDKIPVFNFLGRSLHDLRTMALSLQRRLKSQNINSEVLESFGYTGGGSLPANKISSFAVNILPVDNSKDFTRKIYLSLLKNDPPVLSVMREGNLFIDVLTLFKEEIPLVAQALKNSFAISNSPYAKRLE